MGLTHMTKKINVETKGDINVDLFLDFLLPLIKVQVREKQNEQQSSDLFKIEQRQE